MSSMFTLITCCRGFRPLAVGCFGVLAFISMPTIAQGQQPPFPFSDPQKMFEQFFGAAPQEDRAELDKIKISARDEAQLGERASREYLAELRRQGIKVVTRGAGSLRSPDETLPGTSGYDAKRQALYWNRKSGTSRASLGERVLSRATPGK